MVTQHEWVQQVKVRGLTEAVGLALDALEPLGPLGAQVLWVLQPVLGLLIARETVSALAEALEEPGGIQRLRQELERQSEDN